MKILILGGTGFLGTHLKQKLIHQHQVFTFSRKNIEGSDHIVGSILSEEDLTNAFEGIEAVINLVGLSPIIETRVSYEEIHVQGVNNILSAANRNKQLKRIIHISALGVDKDIDTRYYQTKLKAEQLLLESDQKVSIIRPSFIFGVGMELESMLRPFKMIHTFPVPSLRAKQQPIHISDLIQLIKDSLNDKEQKTSKNIAGPEQLTLTELSYQYAKAIGLTPFLLPKFFNHAVRFAPYLPFSNLNKEFPHVSRLDVVLDPKQSNNTVGKIKFSEWCQEINDNR